jgi:hypothetical protein
MPMSPRLLRPVTSGFHPEAQVWRNAVIANGGSVSASTVKAVSDFCKSIDQAGIRDRFYRLNLFAGTGLNAALVPLYRNTSAAGSVLGNSTDTNNGPFVSDDYSETGATAGLVGNGSSKYLATGFNPTGTASESAFHLSVYVSGTEAGGATRCFLGSFPAETVIGHLSTGSVQRGNIGAASGQRVGPASFQEGFLSVATNGSRSQQFYVNGATSGSADTGVGAFQNVALHVFAVNNNGTPAFFALAPKLRMYSIGLGMSAGDMAAFNTAIQAFQTALGRNV